MEIFTFIGSIVFIFILLILLILRINKLNKSDDVIIKPPLADIKIKSSSDNANDNNGNLNKALAKLDGMFAELKDAQNDPDGVEVFNATYGLAIELYYLDYDGILLCSDTEKFHSVLSSKGINFKTTDLLISLINDVRILMYDFKGPNSAHQVAEFTPLMIAHGTFAFLLDENKNLHQSIKNILTKAYSQEISNRILTIVTYYEATKHTLLLTPENFCYLNQDKLNKQQLLGFFNYIMLLHIPELAKEVFNSNKRKMGDDGIKDAINSLHKHSEVLYGLDGQAYTECISGIASFIATIYGFDNNKHIVRALVDHQDEVINSLNILHSKRRLLSYCYRFFCEGQINHILSKASQELTLQQQKDLEELLSHFGKIFIYYKFLLNYSTQGSLTRSESTNDPYSTNTILSTSEPQLDIILNKMISSLSSERNISNDTAKLFVEQQTAEAKLYALSLIEAGLTSKNSERVHELSEDKNMKFYGSNPELIIHAMQTLEARSNKKWTYDEAGQIFVYAGYGIQDEDIIRYTILSDWHMSSEDADNIINITKKFEADNLLVAGLTQARRQSSIVTRTLGEDHLSTLLTERIVNAISNLTSNNQNYPKSDIYKFLTEIALLSSDQTADIIIDVININYSKNRKKLSDSPVYIFCDKLTKIKINCAMISTKQRFDNQEKTFDLDISQDSTAVARCFYDIGFRATIEPEEKWVRSVLYGQAGKSKSYADQIIINMKLMEGVELVRGLLITNDSTELDDNEKELLYVYFANNHEWGLEGDQVDFIILMGTMAASLINHAITSRVNEFIAEKTYRSTSIYKSLTRPI